MDLLSDKSIFKVFSGPFPAGLLAGFSQAAVQELPALSFLCGKSHFNSFNITIVYFFLEFKIRYLTTTPTSLNSQK
jgi:hypothetical protein